MGRKRKNGEGTVRLRADGRWEGRVVIGYDEKGLPKTKNVLAKTKGECAEKLKTLKESIAPATPNKVKADMPFGAWLEYWYERFCKPNMRPSSRQNYEGFIRLYIIPKLGRIPLNKLTANDLQQLFSWMKKDGRIKHRETMGPGLSDRMLLNCLSLCRRALEQAVTDKLISQSPALDCKTPPIKRKEMLLLTREELQRFLIQAKYDGYYEVFLLELSTGLRQGELIALQWTDLNFTTGELRIDKQVNRVDGKLTVSEPKTKATVRTIILPEPVLTVLKKYKSNVDSRWMFPSPRIEDQPYDPAHLRRTMNRILEEAGCRQVRFHDLRHVFATNALAQGMDVKTLSTIIGHVSTSTTLNVYAHATDTMREAAAIKIDIGIAKAEPMESCKEAAKPAMTTFQAVRKERRRYGTGHIGKSSANRWGGCYTTPWPDGSKHTRYVHAGTEEECEKLLAELILEMKAEAAAERKRLKEESQAS